MSLRGNYGCDLWKADIDISCLNTWLQIKLEDMWLRDPSPFYANHRITAEIQTTGSQINCEKVCRLISIMIESIRCPNLTTVHANNVFISSGTPFSGASSSEMASPVQ